MLTALKTIVSAIAGARDWWTLILVGAAAAYFYVDGSHLRADRDAWAAWGGELCAHAGASTAPAAVRVDTDRGKRIVEKERGELCMEAIADLARFKRETDAATARIAAEALAQRNRKSAADAARAAADADAARAAAERMEKADAKIVDDRVDGPWFDALNDLGGLRRDR